MAQRLLEPHMTDPHQNSLNAQLVEAIYGEETRDAKRLLDAGADPCAEVHDVVMMRRGSAMEAAMTAASRVMVRVLLDAGADPAVRSARNAQQPLEAAIHWSKPGRDEFAAWFAEQPEHVAAVGRLKMDELLMAAAEDDCLRVMQVLLGPKYAAHVTPTDLGAALLRAASNAGGALVRALLQAGAPVTANESNPADIVRSRRVSVLHHALGNQNKEVLPMLIEAGAPLEAKNGDSRTPLLQAISEGRLEAVQLLLQAGASVQARDREGRGVLHYAVDRVEIQLLQMLIAAGADVNAVDDRGRSALHEAAVRFKSEHVVCLLKAGARVDLHDQNGWTPLHSAANSRLQWSTSSGTVAALLRVGADPDEVDSLGLTALHHAVGVGNVTVAQELLDGGARMDLIDAKGRSALDLALGESSAQTSMDCIRLLLERGAPPPTHREALNERLAIEVRQGSADDVELLVTHGADLGCRVNGRTLIQHAGRNEPVKRLLRALASQAKIDSAMGDPEDDWVPTRSSSGMSPL